MKHSHRRASGFTLIEILVVLAIAALVSSILFAAFRSVSEGNKKASCQSNLVQIYQATRLYTQDFNGDLPYLNPGVITTGVPQNGLGLWALYGYPTSDRVDCDGVTSELPNPRDSQSGVAPLASYIKTPRLFHCPYDSFARDTLQTPTNDGCAAPASSQLQSDVLQYTVGGQEYLNPYYLSYQIADNTLTANADKAPYSSFRAPGSKRQLAYFTNTPTLKVNRTVRPADTTIITWCRFHRDLDENGNTVVNAGNYDNVLFADGTVQYIPTKQAIGTAICEGWQRLPIEVANRAPYNTATECPTNSP